MDLAKQLEECKSQLFNLQPVQNSPDDEIVELYSKLCATISNFADLYFGDANGCVARLMRALTLEDYWWAGGHYQTVPAGLLTPLPTLSLLSSKCSSGTCWNGQRLVDMLSWPPRKAATSTALST